MRLASQPQRVPRSKGKRQGRAIAYSFNDKDSVTYNGYLNNSSIIQMQAEKVKNIDFRVRNALTRFDDFTPTQEVSPFNNYLDSVQRMLDDGLSKDERTAISFPNQKDVQSKNIPVIQRAAADHVDEMADDDDDHFDGESDEQDADWSELNIDVIEQRLGNGADDVLFNIFLNLVRHHLGQEMGEDDNYRDAFEQWTAEGVMTRGRFKGLISDSLMVTDADDESYDILQMAREGGTYSYNTDQNGNYIGTHNNHTYLNIIYLRDGQGNIDFRVNPAQEREEFNNEAGENIEEDDIDWEYPVDNDSQIDMGGMLANPNEALMPSGKKINLVTGSRAQHFAIADSLYDNEREGTWTWHHLSNEFEMILVDMRVHAKHGHNGGVHLWREQ